MRLLLRDFSKPQVSVTSLCKQGSCSHATGLLRLNEITHRKHQVFLYSNLSSWLSFLDFILMTGSLHGWAWSHKWIQSTTQMVLLIFYSLFQFNAPQHAYLIYSLSQHLAHKFEELQVILMNIRCGRRVESLVPTGCLQKWQRLKAL